MSANARPRDAQAGWQIYRESGYQATLEEINAGLMRRGFSPIRQRTYDHYRKLYRYGYQRYVPINVVDVETHRSPPWGSPLRSRYRPRPAHIDVQLVIVTETRTVTVDAQTVELSNAEVSIRVATEVIAGLTDIGIASLEGVHVLVAFEAARHEPARSAEVELVFPEPDQPFTILTLAFLTPMQKSEVPDQVLMPAGVVTVSLEVVDPSSPDVLVRTLTALFEAFDASRVLTDEVLGKLDREARLALPVVTVSQLTMSSPLVVVVAGAEAVLGFVWWQIRGLLKLRQQWYAGSVLKSRAHVGEAESLSKLAGADLTDAQARFLDEQTRALRIRNDLAQHTAEVDSAAAVAVLVRMLGQAAPQLMSTSLTSDENELISELFHNQVLPSLEKLLASTLTSIEIKPDPAFDERLQTMLPDEDDAGNGEREDDRGKA